MRLIDADSIKFIEYVNGDITVSKKAIENMPTAYDVDKIVEQIRNIPHGSPLNVELEEEIIKIIKLGGKTE